MPNEGREFGRLIGMRINIGTRRHPRKFISPLDQSLKQGNCHSVRVETPFSERAEIAVLDHAALQEAGKIVDDLRVQMGS